MDPSQIENLGTTGFLIMAGTTLLATLGKEFIRAWKPHLVQSSAPQELRDALGLLRRTLEKIAGLNNGHGALSGQIQQLHSDLRRVEETLQDVRDRVLFLTPPKE